MVAPAKVFLHLELKTRAIAIGERIKGGTFRPCIETIPTSTLKGALKEHFGLANVSAIGFFREGTYERDLLTYAPFDTFLASAKLPISLEFLKPASGNGAIQADVFVVKDDRVDTLINASLIEISLGALKSKALGRCQLRYVGEVRAESKVGYLRGRMLEEECGVFGVTKVIKVCPGYLFYPTSELHGVYKRALFEGSIIEAPSILIAEEYKYDY